MLRWKKDNFKIFSRQFLWPTNVTQWNNKKLPFDAFRRAFLWPKICDKNYQIIVISFSLNIGCDTAVCHEGLIVISFYYIYFQTIFQAFSTEPLVKVVLQLLFILPQIIVQYITPGLIFHFWITQTAHFSATVSLIQLIILNEVLCI